MTNLEIICNEAIAHKIYTKEEIETMLMLGVSPNLHTFAMWKAKGYRVKKGEHAVICTKLWKPKQNKYKNEKGETIKEDDPSYMYLCKSYLFSAEQVEKVGA